LGFTGIDEAYRLRPLLHIGPSCLAQACRVSAQRRPGMSSNQIRSEHPRAARGRKNNRMWLVWMAAGCGVGSVLPHVMV